MKKGKFLILGRQTSPIMSGPQGTLSSLDPANTCGEAQHLHTLDAQWSRPVQATELSAEQWSPPSSALWQWEPFEGHPQLYMTCLGLAGNKQHGLP